MVAAEPAQHLEAFFALNVGGETDVPERNPTYFTIGMDREELAQIEGLRLAPVEDGRFTIDGLDPSADYWFCAGEHDADRVELHTCDAPTSPSPDHSSRTGPAKRARSPSTRAIERR